MTKYRAADWSLCRYQGWRRRILLCLVIAVVSSFGSALGQEPDLVRVARWKAAIVKDTQLPPTEKAEILGMYDEATRLLQGSLQFRAKQYGHQRRKTALEKDIRILHDELLRPAVYKIAPENLKEESQTADEALDRALTERNVQMRLIGDLSRRASDVTKKQDEIYKRQTELRVAAEGIDDQFAVTKLTSGSEAYEAAARVLTQCKKLAIQAEIDTLNAEKDELQAVRSMNPLQRDAAKLRLEAADGAIEKLRLRSRAAHDREAARELAQAQTIAQEAAKASPQLRSAANDVIDFSKRLWEPSGVIVTQRDVLGRTERMRRQDARVQELRTSIERRYEAAGRFAPLSEWLQHIPTDLPNAAEIRRLRRIQLGNAAALRRDILSLEEQRGTEAALESQVDQVLASRSPDTEVSAAGLSAKARTVFQLRRNLSEDLLRLSRELDARITEFDKVSAELVRHIDDLGAFVRERVLWSRSFAEPPSPRRAATALLWFVWNPEWKAVLHAISFWKGAFIAGLLVLAALGYLWVRRRLATASIAGFLAGSAGSTFLKTAIWAAAVPAALLCLAALFDSPESPALGRALYAGFTEAAYLLFPLMFMSCAMADGGLAERHLGWPTVARKVVRGELKWLRVVLPLLWFFVASLAEVGSILSGDPFLQASKNSLGMFAYTAAMICTFVAAIRVLHPASGVAGEIRGRSDKGLLFRLPVHRAALVFAVLLFIGIAVAGFFMTALILAKNTFWTVCLTAVLTLAAWIMLRWRENRTRLLLDTGNATSSRTDRDEAQVRQLGRFGLTILWIVAALAIWSNIFPALSRLEQVEILPARTQAPSQPAQGNAGPKAAVGVPQSQSTGSRSDPGSASGPLTLLDVLKVILAANVMVILVKNVPGLLHFAVLNRFRLDAGAIYAASALARYLVILIGMAVISGILGIRWSQVQWLAAALTFGIGFGLQEIFANFASGLILLFDRSIRVGDAVSIGEFSGRVSRIQMRATTVTLWNRSEMIVPNKEFMTSKLVNWTLSLPETRVDVKVGVAYGSDLDLVRKVLHRVATSNPNVLAAPAPDVLLTAFAESSINFELRVFCLYEFGSMTLLDQLHTAVYREFSDNGISIAYPQLDVHVQNEGSGLSRTTSSVANS